MSNMVEIVTAFENGEQIECSAIDGDTWVPVQFPAFNFGVNVYRIVVSPKQEIARLKELLVACLNDLEEWQTISVDQFGSPDGDTAELIDEIESALC